MLCHLPDSCRQRSLAEGAIDRSKLVSSLHCYQVGQKLGKGRGQRSDLALCLPSLVYLNG